MILGIGTDLVRVERFESWLEKPELMRRFFGDRELKYCLDQGQGAAASLAARFAAKEAFGKAIGTGLSGMRLRDIEVIRDRGSEPKLSLRNGARSRFDQVCAAFGIASGSTALHLSLTHEREHALAFVVFERRDFKEGDTHGNG